MVVLKEVFARKTLNIAHRGARSLAPENTLAAARKALDAGADMWELDVAMTADGHPVVLHDTTLERTSNARLVFPNRSPWLSHDFTLEEIRRLSFGSWFASQDPFGQIAAGAVPSRDIEAYAAEPAPLLLEALKFTLHHDWLVNIEIKNLGDTPGNRTIVEQVMEMVVALDMLDRVLVSSFRHDYLRRAKAACPEVLTGALVDREHPDPPALLEDLGTFSYHPKTSAICFNDIHALRDRGIPVLVWTANDTATMKALIRAGASGIFTDFPQILHSCIHLQNREKLP